jgi:phosphoglucosamine mutase
LSLRFGTDGVRGVAGTELTPELVVALGRAAARVVAAAGATEVLIGRDTRRSGPVIQAALSAGLAGEGLDVVDLGVLPTPGVAAVAAARRVAAAVISASHNPYYDNGIKLFGPGGRKISDHEEERIEALLSEWVGVGYGHPAASHERVGRLSADLDARTWYCDRLVDALDGRRLGGLPLVIDCANGAASATAADVLVAAGAEVLEVLAATPDGININAGCGSTDPSSLANAVVAHGAAAGLAFDGDADRVIAVDQAGAVVDGDRLLALFASDLHDRGVLAGGTVVVTVMTNRGFHLAMAEAGVAVHETPVGDRAVLEALDGHSWSLGGEQSGHVIFRDLATTGDGVLSGLMLCDLLVRSGRSLADLAGAAMERLPQVLLNVRVRDRDALDGAGPVWAEVRAVEAELGDRGRVLLRPSGTEPMVRVMVEAASEAQASEAADRLAGVVVSTLGTG